MKCGLKLIVGVATGFAVGALVAYRLAPGSALGLLAFLSALAAGACFGLLPDARTAVDAEPDTERARTPATPSDGRDYLQTVVDGIPVVAMIVGRDHRITMANRAARAMVGGGDLAGGRLTCHEVSHHSSAPCEGLAGPCPWKQVLATKKPATVVHSHYDADDQEILVEISATPVFDEAGEVVEMIQACRQIGPSHRAGVAALTT